MKVVEGALLESSPNPRLVLFGKERKGMVDVGVIRDELPIEICEAKEGMDSLDRSGEFHASIADSLTGSILTSPLLMMRPRYSMEGVSKVHLESLTERPCL